MKILTGNGRVRPATPILTPAFAEASAGKLSAASSCFRTRSLKGRGRLGKALGKVATAILMLGLSAGIALAADPEAGKVVALRGGVTIARGGSSVEAKVKSPILAHDTVKTGAAARAKLLFIDDSVLTLGEKSQLVVQEFIHEKGKIGTSIYNLLDGKMRSVVGKTKFEVKTPTAVASARGTIIFFDVGQHNNQAFSKIICLEGKVEVRSILPGITGSVLLTPGHMVVVKGGEAPPPPAPAPKSELDNARQATSQSGTSGDGGSSGGSSAGSSTGTGTGSDNPVTLPPPPPPPPPATPTKVNVNITIPTGAR
ncbi:FecR family protein [Geomesophilobacter sediminis]|uniref:FecR domain-containing protein n=1 Tax=Geomesophilobacter sediminis TaxID=2798584 RepID=A0A8J7LYK4_9BACT|nr:FecR family protein [Geomesophilobacter sediminis]MBJ6724957.1 FecR domain-containing protein [Geomesophilobacter sediminis]